MPKKSIFETYYIREEFVDRKVSTEEAGVDVIIPLINTNELWKSNLYSFYREIPINRLLIGDGGCTDNSIEIVKKFPRVEVVDCSKYVSLGYCVKKLMELVETEWFVYLHADVYLPERWYDEMVKHQGRYDWFECYRKVTPLLELWSEEQHKAERAYSGSQMGRIAAFRDVLPEIDDDYLQRNEDIIFMELIQEKGFNYARVNNTFHYHQVMNREGEMEPKYKHFSIGKEKDEEWGIRMGTMYVKGIIKYLGPKPYLVAEVNWSIGRLLTNKALDWASFKHWVRDTNPIWLRHISKKQYLALKATKKAKGLLKLLRTRLRL